MKIQNYFNTTNFKASVNPKEQIEKENPEISTSEVEEILDGEIQTSENLGKNHGKAELAASTGEYKTVGEKADSDKNPITKEHLKTIFNCFNTLEKKGFVHQNLSLNHVFYSKNGKVEIDGLRYGISNKEAERKTEIKGAPLNNFPVPSNIESYEILSVKDHFLKNGNMTKRQEFLLDYFEAASEYYENRAEYIKEEGASEEQIEYEASAAKLFKNPSTDLMSFYITKLKGIDAVGNCQRDDYGDSKKVDKAIETLNMSHKKASLCLKAAEDKFPEYVPYFSHEKESAKNLLDKTIEKAVEAGLTIPEIDEKELPGKAYLGESIRGLEKTNEASQANCGRGGSSLIEVRAWYDEPNETHLITPAEYAKGRFSVGGINYIVSHKV